MRPQVVALHPPARVAPNPNNVCLVYELLLLQPVSRGGAIRRSSYWVVRTTMWSAFTTQL
jgi:hypothetical protein